ncbi:unnamed protein product [Phyllotreta striolata]|uniref:Uncharacterized protein n=1 Tax=Phyllotreta striolata TaxID=444603 RepID=A0A9N9TAV5_PHYSR|nr:unnamed protein product [Phyllotreta striolata]
MKWFLLVSFTILLHSSLQSCVSKRGVTTCTENALPRSGPMRIENYQNLVEFTPGHLRIIPSGIFRLLTELKILFLSSNEISTVEIGAFDGLYNLEKLSLYANKLETIPAGVFRDLRSLKELNLGMNQIASISEDAFAGLLQLEVLNLGFNQLSTVPEALKMLRTLKVLSIKNNQLKKILPHSFGTLGSLEILNLSDNGITEVQNKAFKGLIKVEELDLKSNYLAKLNIQDILEDLRELKTLKLAVNSFSCNNLKEIDNVLKRKRITLASGYYNKPGSKTYNGMVCTV